VIAIPVAEEKAATTEVTKDTKKLFFEVFVQASCFFVLKL